MDKTITVALIGGLATVAGAIIAGLFTLRKRGKSASNATQTANASGGYAISAGGNVSIHSEIGNEFHRPAKLEITDVGFTHEAEFDIKVRNLGDDAIIINRISILLVKDLRGLVLPILRPTAKYEIPVDGLREGESRSINVSHLVDAHGADRFLISLNTTREYRLRVTLHYNLDEEVSFERDIWQ